MTTLHKFIALLLASLCIAAKVNAAELPAAEKAKIETLLAGIEKLEGAVFIRNGSEYDPKSAAKFLRKKWESHGKDIVTASEFIAKIATLSTTTGKPYLIRLKDGTELKSADNLTAQLKKLEATAAENPAAPK